MRPLPPIRAAPAEGGIMASMEDVCLICAETLDYVSVYGECGHRDVCVKCCLRLRLIGDDDRCCACQRTSKHVLVTKHQGTFTAKLPVGMDGAQMRKIYHAMPGRNDVLFDDQEKMMESARSCALLCSVCESKGQSSGGTDDKADESKKGGRKRKHAIGFRSLGSLKAHLKEHHQLFLCDVCVQGRKVFPQEQVLYTKAELSRHYTKGDTKGPMAEAGFKGHPMCQFCKKYFYSDQELYSHMQTAHMLCFICRRERPDEYIYYKNLAELEGHFASRHHLCTHDACRNKHPEERVYATAEAFRVHFVQEHGEHLSKQQKKQALQIGMAYPSLRQDRQQRHINADNGRHYSSRGERAREEPPRPPRPSPPPPSGDESDDVFAHVDSQQQPWRNAIGSHGGGYNAAGGTVMSSGAFRSYQAEEYPSLPGTSRGAKKKAKAKVRAQAGMDYDAPGGLGGSGGSGGSGGLGNAGNAGVGGGAWSAGGAGPSGGIEQRAAAATQAARTQNKLLMQRLRSELDNIVFASFRQYSGKFLEGKISTPQYFKQILALGLLDYAPDLANLCPEEGKRKELLRLVQSHMMQHASHAAPEGEGGMGGASSHPTHPTHTRLDRRSDQDKFVNLASLLRGSGQGSGQAVAHGGAASSRPQVQRPPAATPSPFPSPSPPPSPSPSPSPSPTPPRVVTEEAKRANRMLMQRLKGELADEATFAGFRMKSAEFLKGKIGAEQYFDLLVSLGLLDYAVDLAKLCPDKRKQVRYVPFPPLPFPPLPSLPMHPFLLQTPDTCLPFPSPRHAIFPVLRQRCCLPLPRTPFSSCTRAA